MKKKLKKAELGRELKAKPLSDGVLSSARLTSPQPVNSFNIIGQKEFEKAINDQANSLQYPKEGFNYGQLIQPALSLINTLIPGDRPDRWKTVQPLSVENLMPYGNGSQAIAEKGKTLKAPDGIELPPTKASSFKYTHNNDTDFSGLTDALGYSLAKGVNPLQDNVGMQMMNSNNPVKRKLIDSVIAYNQTNPNQGDGAINNYYNTISQDPDIQAFKQQALSRYANDPYASYKKSPNVQINPTDQTPLLAKMPDGGQVAPWEPKKAVSESTRINKKVVLQKNKHTDNVLALNYLKEDEKERKDLEISEAIEQTYQKNSNYQKSNDRLEVKDGNTSFSASSLFIKDVAEKARQRGIDPEIALALAYQESRLGTQGAGYNNPFHKLLIDNEDYKIGIDGGLDFFNSKVNYAKSLGKTSEQDLIQSYNGYGKVGRNTEGKQKSMYGVPIPKEGLDMNQNPLYGNKIIEIRDNIIRKDTNIQDIISGKRQPKEENYRKPPKTNNSSKNSFTIEEFKDGGELPAHTVHGFKKKSTRKIYDKIQREDPNAYHALMKLGEEYRFSSLERGGGRSHYNPLTNTTTIAPAVEGDDQVIVDELSHKIQFDKGALRSTNKFLTNDVMSYLSGGDPYTTKGTLEYQAHKEIAPKLRDKFYKEADYKNGGDIGNPLQIENHQPISQATTMITGNSHADGGTNVQYGNTIIEAEKGEPLSINSDGNATIWGNLKVPGTKEKFKNVVKKIGNKEAKYDKLQKKGVELLEGNPNSKFAQLAMNAGKVMNEGAEMAKQDLSEKKDALAMIQSALLAEKPKKAKNGAIIAKDGYTSGDPIPKKKALTFKQLSDLAAPKGKGSKKAIQDTFQQFYQSQPAVVTDNPATNGKQSVAVRHNNPGNIKFGSFAKKFGATQGDAGTDGGEFAHFPSVEAGMNALKSLLKTKNYKDLPVEEAIKRWTNGSGYSTPLGDLRGKKVKDLDADGFNKLVNHITYGEDGKYYKDPSTSTTTPQTPSTAIIPLPKGPSRNLQLPGAPFNPTTPTAPSFEQPEIPSLGTITPSRDRNMPSNAENLSVTQILPELYALGKNQVQPVPMQQVNPNLFSPYSVSFQDRLNSNNSTFSALNRQLSGNPALLQGLAANKYSADSQVQAEEFRTNQSIYNDIVNKNTALLNDSQMKNLALADQQYVRQQGAKDNTDAQNQMILNSLSSKELQNSYENKRVAAYENLYDFRMMDSNNDGTPDKATYFGPDAQFGQTPSSGDQFSRTRNTFVDGLLKSSQITTPSQMDIEKQQLDINTKKAANAKNLLMRSTFPGMFRSGKP